MLEVKGMQMVDLTHYIGEDMPMYPGTEPPQINKACHIEEDGFAERKITLFSHTGTHIDGPSHVFPGGKSLDVLPVEYFYGRAVVLDFTGNQTGIIGPAELEPYRHEVENSQFVLLCTGWSRYWGLPQYFCAFPALSQEGAEWLCQFDLKGVGIDAISVDRVGNWALPAHKALLGRQILIIENLTNLASLKGREIMFFCFPLKIREADGSPIRATACLL